ncbi:hypothetical protein HHI36_009041 [Cryptolaemus montrouzieri]|uniref:Cilia- and flagella-associated protein 157 n=1 Tax=Cryptolaemus montrouzieri TaxID=559131 RepID=A0ABD2MU45_9CUCU
MKDYEICKESNTSLQNQLENMVIKEDSSFTKRYEAVQGKLMNILEKNTELNNEIEAQAKIFDTRRLEIEHYYAEKLKDLEDKLKQANSKLNQREKEFFDELQMAQATSAYEFEKIEEKLKWQLSEANKKLHESKVVNAKLRMQLQNMERQQNKYIPHDTPTRAEKNLQLNMNRCNVSLDYTGNTNELNKSLEKGAEQPMKESELPQKNFTGTIRAYEPLQVIRSSSFENKPIAEIDFGKPTAPLFRGKKTYSTGSRYKYCKTSESLVTVPPLIPCTNSVPIKKRRLHDPDDLSYLVDLMPNENVK